MADGTHCPECGEDVGFWAVARSLFGVRCPHCGARLRHQLSPGMGALTTAGALGSVVAALAVAAAAGWAVGVRAGPVAGLAVGAAVCWVLAFAIGFVFQLAVTPVLRRTQALVPRGRPGEAADEDSW